MLFYSKICCDYIGPNGFKIIAKGTPVFYMIVLSSGKMRKVDLTIVGDADPPSLS
jgi:hypothetical protein